MILNLLIEGMAMRAISRTTGASINTVTSLPVAAGEACSEYHDRTVRNVNVRFVQCDGIWAFRHARERNVGEARAGTEDP